MLEMKLGSCTASEAFLPELFQAKKYVQFLNISFWGTVTFIHVLKREQMLAISPSFSTQPPQHQQEMRLLVQWVDSFFQ